MTNELPWLPPEEDGSPAIRGPGGWHEHTPGSPCPVADDVLVQVVMKYRRWPSVPRRASDWWWGGKSPYDSSDIYAYRLACPEARRLEAENARLRAVLTEAVSLYGQPGGPWNVPSDPGGWLGRVRAALEGNDADPA